MGSATTFPSRPSTWSARSKRRSRRQKRCSKANSMAKQMQVDIVSAEQEIFSGKADMVIAPGEAGELGIMPEHAPLLTRIKPGTVRIQQGGQDTEVIYVSGGMMEVQPDSVTVLADTSIRAHDLDEAKAL